MSFESVVISLNALRQWFVRDSEENCADLNEDIKSAH
jgi:hypothetical protein